MTTGNLARYFLWGATLLTAMANRQHFGLATTWVFHLVGNSLTLLLPDLYRGFSRMSGLDRRLKQSGPLTSGVRTAFREIVVDNPHYVEYVAPLALGYIVSHPRFNIYRGAWGKFQILGFGLDTIPHGTTAYALTRLILDTARALGRWVPASAPAGPEATWLGRHATLVAGGTLLLLTVAYESFEFLIHQIELRATGGNPRKINMEWSVADTVTDVLANVAGVVIALVQFGGKPR